MDVLERVKNLIEKLANQKLSIAVAESCTGGFISHMFTNIPGSSMVFERAIVSYSNRSKIELLNIEANVIEKHGAISECIAKLMATNIRELSKVDIGISATGIAGPTGGSLKKPVGLVYIGISTKEKTVVEKHFITAGRISFKTEVLIRILNYFEKDF